MRQRLPLLVFLVFVSVSALAKDVYLSVGGSVGVFRTDTRILNPSFDKSITITARYLPAGNTDNSAVATKTITLGKRAMAVYDDVVQSLFGGGPALGAVRLTSDDDFIATQRIYADKTADRQGGTLGQFVPGLEVSTALRKGALIQLKSGATGANTFRTNWGGVNPNAATANVKLRLYDKANALVGSEVTISMPPFAVISPQNIAGTFSPSDQLSDAWISFESDQPVFLYASVLDNGSEDPTFITASQDTGVAPTQPPPQTKTVTVTAMNWDFIVDPSATLNAGDEVKFIITSSSGSHGFQLFAPNSTSLISVTVSQGQTIERTITLPSNGVYTYLCTVSSCGFSPGQHDAMNGTFNVGTAGDGGGRPDY